MAQELYQRAYQRGQFGKIKAILTKRSRHLYKMATVQRTCRIGDHQHIGTEAVPISQIRGTGGRAHDFDIDFYPLQLHNEDRWKGVAVALNTGKKLPPVKLIQVEKLYFVQDGHHRISIARALGQDHVEASAVAHGRGGEADHGPRSFAAGFKQVRRLEDFRRVRIWVVDVAMDW